MSLFKRIKKLIINRFYPHSKSEEIKNAIKQCDDAIFNCQRDIYLLKNNIVELFEQTFLYPKELKYQEIENFDLIINSQPKQNVSQQEVNDVIDICTNYYNQIKVRKIKIEALKQNKKDLSALLEQFLTVEAKIKSQQMLNELILKNKQNLQQIENLDTGEEIHIREKIKDLNQEIKLLNDKLNEYKEFNKQIKLLYNKFSVYNQPIDPQQYHNEIKKLIDKKSIND